MVLGARSAGRQAIRDQSARLGRAAQEAGAKVTCIDWRGNRHQPAVSIRRMDLTTSEGQQQLQAIIEETDPHHIHFALPCGTLSKARERRMTAAERAAARRRTQGQRGASQAQESRRME